MALYSLEEYMIVMIPVIIIPPAAIGKNFKLLSIIYTGAIPKLLVEILRQAQYSIPRHVALSITPANAEALLRNKQQQLIRRLLFVK